MSSQFSISYAYFYLLAAAWFHLCHGLCMNEERRALLQFKDDLIDEGERLASWVGEETDCCEWAGIACDNTTGHVHQIHLPGLEGRCRIRDYRTDKEYKEASKRRFRGNLSSSLLRLKQLRDLDISCNDFEGIQVPSFIGSLANLRYLNLSNSKFGGIIPPHLGNLSNLQVLCLGGFPDTVDAESSSILSMQWLSSLRMMYHLDLSSVDLSKATDWFQVINTLPSLAELRLPSCRLSNIHSDVSSLNISSLSSLDLSYNVFTTFVPPWIFSIASLVSLDLSMCGFEGFIPSSKLDFRNLTSLEFLHVQWNPFINSSLVLEALSTSIGGNLILLDISSCGVSSAVLDSLHNMTSLLSLDLTGNELTKAIPRSLGNFCNLRDLDLSNIGSFDVSLADILESFFECKSPALESLFMNRMQLYGHLPEQLGQLIHLEHLELKDNNINGKIPDSIGQLSSLRTLSLTWNQISGPIPFTIGRLSLLEVLELSGNSLNSSFPDSFDQLSKLERIDFSYTLLTGPIPSSIRNLSSIKFLDLSNNRFTGSLPDSIGQLPSLKMLDISKNRLNGSLPDSIGQLSSLKVLQLSENRLSGNLPDSIGQLSLLEVMDLSNNQLNGSVPDAFSQLPNLERLDFSYNFLTGPIPKSIGRLSSLDHLDLSSNQFAISLPESLGHLQKLTFLSIDNNLLNGSINVNHFSNLTALKTLLAENNKLTLLPSVEHWVPPFQLDELKISCWNIGPRFPSWLRSQKDLRLLNIANTGISDIMPSWFWSSFSNIEYLNISHNNIQGQLIGNFSMFGSLPVVDLSNNRFEGPLPGKFSQVDFVFLDVSNNHLSGSLKQFVCATSLVYRSLWVLDLANNRLSGIIPDCWLNWEALMVLNFENNGLSGGIPQSVGNLSSLQVFKMRNNKLSGRLPASLFNIKSLQIIELAENELTGSIPLLIEQKESKLKLLSLRSNKLKGEIPDELCRFTSIRILDLAHNNLSGTLPTCFHNFTSMSENQNLTAYLEDQGSGVFGISQVVVDFELQAVSLVIKGSEYKYDTILFLVTTIDLSENEFSGPIPEELMGLVGLRFMNLSGNHITGRIPKQIGKMTSLESLDLSVNQLNGNIPWNISSLTSLNSLNVSFNRLTGEIPKSTQLQSLSESSFMGNSLCGAPLAEQCNKKEISTDDASRGDLSSDGQDWGLIISIVIGFVIGFWGVVAPLIASQVWRNVYFYFLYRVWFKIRITFRKYF